MRLGSLFSGYGGLDIAVTTVFPATTAWVSDFESGPNKVLAHRYPDVPNLGDITKIDWTQVEPVDIIAGGFPCQDVSMAGRRAGMTAGTRSNLWGAMRTAIEIIRPQFVVAENVRGLLSATATSDSDMEHDGGPLGNSGAGHLRALGRVLGDLADLGYDASWHSVRASDAGAPHQRHRVFILATDTRGGGSRGRTDVPEASTGRRTNASSYRTDSRLDLSGTAGLRLLPTPTASETGGVGNASQGGPNLRTFVAEKLLPTPVAQPSGNPPAVHLRKKPGRTRVTDLSIIVENGLIKSGGKLLPTPVADNSRGNPSPNSDFASLPNEMVKLLPTPTAERPDARKSEAFSKGRATFFDILDNDKWGQYAPAIERWETILGRPAPTPTEPNKHHRPRLSPRFVEWLMGLPDGHVTDVPGITHTEALRALGNGVVPQQATLALSYLIGTLNTKDQT